MRWKNGNNILTLLLIVCSSYSFSQLNQVDAKGKKQGEWVKYYDGTEFANVVRYKGQFKDDKPFGKFIYYYPSKKIRAIIVHDPNGIRSEAYLYHEENEALAAHGIYKNGKKDSVWTNFLPSGHYSSTETYKNDELDGEKIIFYGPEVTIDKVKLVLRKDHYKDGRLNGPFVEYFPDGVLKGEGVYKEGALDGLVKRYHPNGRLLFEERWKNRKKHGLWKTFDEDGKELGRKYYNNGVSLEGKKLDAYLQDLKSKGISPNE
ncbi:MAG TPA: hypothetical protein VL021_00925 [Brumimicrobium sp.]|nr:hypothetical protein [Brumimicrobium sp.]HTO36957.1 hypothetical protein [Brumimicrobium sp.]